MRPLLSLTLNSSQLIIVGDNDNEQDQPPEWNVLLTKDGPRPPTNEDEGRFPLYDPYYLTTDSIENCRKVDDVEPLWYSPGM